MIPKAPSFVEAFHFEPLFRTSSLTTHYVLSRPSKKPKQDGNRHTSLCEHALGFRCDEPSPSSSMSHSSLTVRCWMNHTRHGNPGRVSIAPRPPPRHLPPRSLRSARAMVRRRRGRALARGAGRVGCPVPKAAGSPRDYGYSPSTIPLMYFSIVVYAPVLSKSPVASAGSFGFRPYLVSQASGMPVLVRCATGAVPTRKRPVGRCCPGLWRSGLFQAGLISPAISHRRRRGHQPEFAVSEQPALASTVVYVSAALLVGRPRGCLWSRLARLGRAARRACVGPVQCASLLVSARLPLT